jgi:amino acid adenylation domain-containing protein
MMSEQDLTVQTAPRAVTNAPSLYGPFVEAVNRKPAHAALEVGGQTWSYAALARLSGQIGSVLAGLGDTPARSGMVGVLASRSLTAFAGSLAVFAAGRTHVALNPQHPPARIADIIRQTGISVVIAGPQSVSLIAQVELLAGRPLTVIAPETDRLDGAAFGHRGPTVGRDEIARQTPLEAHPAENPDQLAYAVFTSGSTGAPKGVAITHGNLAAYLRNFRALAAPEAADRVAQTFELSFDVALHDMLNALWSGATLVVMSERAMLSPARFIRERRITYWFSVASFAMILQRQGVLRPGLFPDLRVSLLCGEPLPRASAAAWAAAAPNSELYNVYGPTETTMELAFYRWQSGISEGQCRRGIAPIGVPFADHRHLLFDRDGTVVAGAGEGELYVEGPQVGAGYWANPAQTEAAFVRLPGRSGRWYRTGDLVERDESGLYHFVARADHMVKLMGHRIELGEIEAALRDLTGADLAAVIAHPVVDGVPQGLVAFVAEGGRLSPDLRLDLAKRLPKAMVPDRVVPLAAFPLNANRKIDRAELARLAQAP